MSGTELLLAFVGSVALLLWGVRMVRTGMMRAFGAALRRVIAARARGRINGFLAGFGLTGLLQSSTATALLLASFAGRGLVPLPAALAVMLGADVASTLLAQAFSFNVKWLWTLFVAGGTVFFMVAGDDRLRGIARVAIGVGLMLLALEHLTAAGATLRGSPTFRSLLSGLAGEPALGFIVAAVAAAAVHSSLAIVLLVMALAGSHVVPVTLALALVLGANVGGALAPLLSLAAAPPAARRVPLGNLAMRASVALALLFLLAPIATGLARLESDPGRLAVDFHTAFNVLVAVLFLPLVGGVARLTERLLPERAQPAEAGQPRHLDESVIEHPSEALACAMRETLRMGDHVADMLRNALTVFERSDARLMREVERADDAVDGLHEAIKLYLVKVSKSEMSDEESRRYIEILSFTTNLEHVGDIIDKNLMELAAKKIKNGYEFSPEGLAEIRRIHARVMDNMRLAFNVFATRDVALARRLLAEKAAMRAAELQAADSHFARLREGRPESIETSSIHLDVIRDLKRINAHLTSVAYPILEITGELRESRLRERAAAEEPAANGGAIAR